jgi:hypothetical protein
MPKKFYMFLCDQKIRKIARPALLLTLILCNVAACGIKPDKVEPPEEAKNGEFPQVYPNLATDPPPYVRPD